VGLIVVDSAPRSSRSLCALAKTLVHDRSVFAIVEVVAVGDCRDRQDCAVRAATILPAATISSHNNWLVHLRDIDLLHRSENGFDAYVKPCVATYDSEV